MGDCFHKKAFAAPVRPGGMRAFTVLELMLAVAVMGVIVYALFSVFNQTQRALRATQTQSDISEKARGIVEMISRELEQAQPTFSAVRQGTNWMAEVNMLGGMQYPPSVQKSDRTDITPRTNFIHNLFFYNFRTNSWLGIGYQVVDYKNGVGALVRFETNVFGHKPRTNLVSTAFLNLPLTNLNFHHVADGVIHLAFIPYDANGNRLGFDTTNRMPGTYNIARKGITGNIIRQRSDTTNALAANVILQQMHAGAPLEYESSFRFLSNAMPAYVDMEFGILEPETLSQYYLMLEDKNPNATNFLARQIAKVHLFRERIPIRTAAQ